MFRIENYESTPVKKPKPTYLETLEDIDNVIDLINPTDDIENNMLVKNSHDEQESWDHQGIDDVTIARLLPDGFTIWKEKYR